ncbi:hypothetical protein [Anaerobiospirillum succiniciproducens]|uniref:hypothetical protein n=1 Tax=Anaerobiospirillum succiniciproducens TaxID=13335 RepID=UPI0029436BD3|nr:hypothetical protein [Anaerobiospirillum succiniciproducens]
MELLPIGDEVTPHRIGVIQLRLWGYPTSDMELSNFGDADINNYCLGTGKSRKTYLSITCIKQVSGWLG